MPEGYKTQLLFNGRIQNVCIDSQVDEITLNKLVELSMVPSGGIHVIHHVPTDPEGNRDYFREFRERNPGFRAYIGYTTFETDRIPEPWVESCNQMDEIWVPSTFNYVTFASSGVKKEKLHVIPHGVNPEYYQPASTVPLKLGDNNGFTFLSIFEWTYRKGWDVLLKAYLEEFDRDEDVRLVIRAYQGGGVIGEKVPSVSEQLANFITNLGHDLERIPTIIFLQKMVPSELMPNLYKTADVFVLPTRGEGWGIPFTESMAMGVPVIATRWGGHLDFMNDANSYLIDVEGIVPVSSKQVADSPYYRGHRWAEPSVEHLKKLMRNAYENRDEVKEKGRIARQHILDNFTVNHVSIRIAQRLLEIESQSQKSISVLLGKRKLRILFQARPDIFTVPGGDTEVVVNLRKIFEENGVCVDFSSNPVVNLKGYDLVHIFNCETPFAINSSLQEVPFVLTPMYEDFGRYYPASMRIFEIFEEYLSCEDVKAVEKKLEEVTAGWSVSNALSELSFVVSAAEFVCVSGKEEKRRIEQDFPEASNIQIVKLGFNRVAERDAVSEELFISEYGVSDFVLCVGRLETRKNQLMLLYALKNEHIPVVFVNSKTVQPRYEAMCKRFKRKGKTIFTGRISKEMLFSAYKAAKVHVLPSWYELPGLVTLEAAWWGCNVVASSWGTIKDYLMNFASYCEPHDPRSIRKAVLEAMHRSYDPRIRKHLENYTWQREAQQVLRIYERVRSRSRKKKGRKKLKQRSELAHKEAMYHQIRGKALYLTDRNPEESLSLTSQLLSFRPDDPTSYFIKGLAYLKMLDLANAEKSFTKTLELRPWFDVKAYLYLSLSLIKQEKYSDAIDVLKQARRFHPFETRKIRALIDEYMFQCRDMLESSKKLRGAA